MEHNFEYCRLCVEQVEGGYVNDPNDRGGMTKHGVTHKTLAKWRGKKVNQSDMKTLTLKEARQIYLEWYWKPAFCDRWPSGLDLGVYDMAVNSGVRNAIKTLQRAAKVTADGQVGPITLKAVINKPHAGLFNDFFAHRMKFYGNAPSWEHHALGWSRRLMQVHEWALGIRNDVR